MMGREEALESFGWTGRQAEWTALACLHSGVFIRAQWSRYLDAHPEQVRRGVHALINQRMATEETVPGIAGIGRVCRIFSRRIYRALGAEDIRHRRTASEEVLIRRLPDRVYRGAAGNTRRYFPQKLPVALEADRAVFVYVDPGHETTTALRSWAAAHRGLWKALGERCRSVEVVAVVRTRKEVERARTIRDNWAGPSAPSEPDPAARREIARIEQAVLEGDDHALGEYGDLQAGLKRIVGLKEKARVEAGRKLIRCGATWQTVRLARVRFR